jgi:hypothetical protein
VIKRVGLFFLWLCFALALSACGGLRYSQISPGMQDFHPRKIAVFPVDVGVNEQARGVMDKMIVDIHISKGWFVKVVSPEEIARQSQSNEELKKSLHQYINKLKMVNFSDPDLCVTIQQLCGIDAFLLVEVESWEYTMEKGDKAGRIGLEMHLIEASTGKTVWKAGHQVIETYKVWKPELSGLAKNLAGKMLSFMPH